MRQGVTKGEKHFTASAWILTDSKPQKILLLYHKKLGKWVQPGGHIEQFENPIQTVIREVKEETGIDISFLFEQMDVIDNDGTFLPSPAFLTEFRIPEYNNDPEHFHLDIQYVIKVPQQSLTFRKKESHGIGWFTKDEALSLPIHGDTHVIIEKLF